MYRKHSMTYTVRTCMKHTHNMHTLYIYILCACYMCVSYIYISELSRSNDIKESLIIAQLVKEFATIYKSKGSFLCSQDVTTDPKPLTIGIS
jgi:hypothetical protein